MSTSEYSSIFNAETIYDNLKNEVDVRFFNTIDSTNNEAKRSSQNINNTPTLFVANHQSGGRGRLGRTFYSPINTGLYMSLMQQTDADFKNIVYLTTAASVCVCKALEDLCNIKPQIKWVNDIYLDSKKICGILCEAITNEASMQIKGIIIGIGINITTQDFPQEISDIASSVGQNIDKSKLCAKITDNLIFALNNPDKSTFVHEYKKRSMVLGKEITYIKDNMHKKGTAIDIDENGGLVIKTNNGYKTLNTGEISVRLHSNE